MGIDWEGVLPMAIGITIFVLLFGGFILMSIGEQYQFNAKIKACEDLNMEKKYINSFNTCVDNEGTAHIADFKCEGFLWETECSVRFIKLSTFGVEME